MIFKVAKPESLAAVLEMLHVETPFPKFGNQISIGVNICPILGNTRAASADLCTDLG